MTIGDEEVEFRFNKTMKGPSMDEVTSVLKAEERSVHEPAEVKVARIPEDEKKKEEFPPGFLPRPNDHKVYAIGEDNYAFWDLLFGEGKKKERERWRSLKVRMEDSSGTEPKRGDRVKMNGR